MTRGTAGILWCLAFVVIEAVLAIYFGAVFQEQDAFLVGALVFGIATLGAVIYSLLFARNEWAAAWSDSEAVVGMNVTAAGGWLAYLFAIQYVEPAVAFALFSGSVPVATMSAARLGLAELPSASRLEVFGNIVIAVALVAISVVTIGGYSGFVRGGPSTAVVGVCLASGSGILIAWMLAYCQRLDSAGVGPMTQFGLRFELFLVFAAGGAFLELDRKGEVEPGPLLMAVCVGLVLMAFPVYAVQRSISLASGLTIRAIAALGPLFVFVFQMIEGRVNFAAATLFCLCIYFIGAIAAAIGSGSLTGSSAAETQLLHDKDG